MEAKRESLLREILEKKAKIKKMCLKGSYSNELKETRAGFNK